MCHDAALKVGGTRMGYAIDWLVRQRWGLAVLLLLPAACGNPGAVGTFAKAGSDVAQYQPVFAAWPQVNDAAARLLNDDFGTFRAAEPDKAAAWDPQSPEARQANTDMPLAEQASRALAAYLGALAALANGADPLTQGEATSIQSSVAKIGIVDTAHKAEVSGLLDLINVPLDVWRQRKVAAIVKSANSDVTLLATFLAVRADNIDHAEQAAAAMTEEFWRFQARRAKDPSLHAPIERADAQDQARYATLRAQAHAASVAFTKIGSGHAVLAAQADDLQAAVVAAALSKDLPALSNAIKLFQTK